jgi:hypothetical protein
MNGSRGRLGALLAGVVVAAGVAGCAADGTGPEERIAPVTAEAIAVFLASTDATAGWAAESLAATRTGTREFSRTAPCPAGGSQTMTGSGTSSHDTAARIFTNSWTTTQSQDRCAFPGREGGPDIVMHGSVTVTGSATYRVPEERGAGRTILTHQTTRVGSTTTSAGDRSRTCEVDLTETFDPATNSFRVVGTVCGRAVDVTRPLNGGRGG